MTGEQALKVCQQVVAQLGEHFDTPSIQILVNWKDDNGNYNFTRAGIGSPQANFGMCEEMTAIYRASVALQLQAKLQQEQAKREQDGLQ